MFDRDGNGKIEYHELANVLRVLGNNPTEKDISGIMEGFDKDSKRSFLWKHV